jgi:PKD repeat protein
MAAPQVAGLAAMLFALGATSPEQVRGLIRSTADDLGASGVDDRFGAGRINAAAAVAEITGAPPPPPPPPEPPTADFSWFCDALTCTFTDASNDPENALTAWSWDFGDGNTSTLQNPSHSYTDAGSYTVTLQVTDGDGLTDAASQSVEVSDLPPPPEPPTADFSWSCDGLTCTFTDASNDPENALTAWSWDFGDGNTSTLQNPSHSYTDAGSYNVTLQVTDGDGLTDAATQTVQATDPSGVVSMYVADIDADPIKGRGGRWTPRVRVLVKDTNGDPVAGADVGGMFGGAISEPENGITGPDGWTTITADASARGNVTVSYRVMAVYLDLSTPYDASRNTDPDGDSDGTTIVFSR